MINNLVDELFDKSKAFQMGIFCTYSLNLDFFENYLLNLSGVANCSSLCVFTDRNVYNSHFNINSAAKPKWINKRYLVVPVNTKGVFHPKLYLLASEKAVRIGIGSANLTREGLASNLEIVSVFEVTEKDRTFSGFLKECLDFLYDLAIVTQSSTAIESVNRFANFVSHLLVSDNNSQVHLLHNLTESIMSRVIRELSEYSVKSIKIISPFYDKNLRVHSFLKNSYPSATFMIYIQQGRSNFPVEKFDFHSKYTEIYLYKYKDRYIHGKALIFETDAGKFMLTGSTNYTESALLSSNLRANIESAIFGKIGDTISKELCYPKDISANKLKDIEMLDVVPIEDNTVIEDGSLRDWLIEVLYENNQIEVTLNKNCDLIPKFVIINEDEDNKIEYNPIIDAKTINKAELNYAYIEGLNNKDQVVKSSKVWIVNLDKERGYTGKRRFCINDPTQIIPILLELIERGSEQELIEYLLKFDIPLDLTLFSTRSKVLGAMESKGNVFGELMKQSKSIFKNPGVFEAAKRFLINNINKLYSHYNNLQLNKLDNFMLIYGTIFNMMSIFNDYITKEHNKNPINAEDWIIIRNYYDMILEHIEEILGLLWVSEDGMSFEELVNRSIKKDKQKMLGSISTFKSFIVKRDYEYQYKSSLSISQRIIRQLDNYIDKAKIKTIDGSIVNALVAKNGIKDVFIVKRNTILKFVNELMSDLESWER